jgi:hypothetical protein
MANYVKATNFYTKDALLTGNPDKIIKGSEIDAEYNAIATAIGSKADTTSPTFTGNPLAPTATAGNNSTQIATTAFVSEALVGLSSNLGDMALQEPDAVAITGGTVAATFTGNLTGNVTGNVTGTVSGNAGTVTNGVYTTNFSGANQSLASDGYQKFPSGLIIQWGTSASVSPNSTTSVTFPIAFPNAVFSITTGANAANSYADGTTNVVSKTTSGFVACNGDNANAFTCSWIAIGY